MRRIIKNAYICNMKFRGLIYCLYFLCVLPIQAANLLIEAESFSQKGGWCVDQQFMDLMGSPYLIAHGMGVPVPDASTVISIPESGEYTVYVRTYNWTSPWHKGKGPGAFALQFGKQKLKTILGQDGDKWMWQSAGKVRLAKGTTTLTLKDLTGFDGRCDAIFLTNTPGELPPAHDKLTVLPDVKDAGHYDLVVVGAGMAGMCAAVSAARLGMKVALLNDRPILGGNNSSEIRVHLGGMIEVEPYPELGGTLKEFALDGDYTTFFQNGWGTDASEYFKVWYDTPQAISQVRVICDASKDYLQYANLYISEDDSTFTLAGKSDDRGNFTVNLDGRRIKSFKIVPTFPSLSRLVIREIEVDKFDFSVLNWNIWQEGTMIKDGYQAVIEELVRLKPDFVTFAEVRNYRDDFLARLCNDLKARGLTYYSFRSDDSGLISHYPILEHNTVFPLKDDHGSVYRLLAQVPDAQGKMREVAVYCTHLDYLNDTYYEVRAYDGSTWKKMDAPLTDVPEILRRNDLSQRDEAIMAFIQEAKKDMEKGRAVVLGGDFNEPSWQDWTEETKELFDHHGVIVPWPQTTRLHQAGFADCFRTIYPDPVKYPGITYPCDNPIAPMKELSWAPESDERERIDLMFFTPSTLQVNSCRVFGPLGDVKRAQRVPGMGQAYTITPKGIWPTDHRGILSTFMFLELGSTK